MNARSNASDTETSWPPSFRGGLRPLLAFGVAFSLWVMASNSLATWLWGPELSSFQENAWSIPSGVVQVSIAVLVLRYEGVRLREIGLSRRLLVPALVAVAGVIVAVNVALVGLAVLGERLLSIGVFQHYRTPPYNMSLSQLALGGVSMYLFTGPVEELAFRGYLQNKLIGLLGDGYNRVRIGVGIVLTGVIFSAIHVPALVLIRGLESNQAVGSLALLAVSGIVLGTIYALTHNLYLVMFLHGIGNFWPLIVDPAPGTWPNWGVVLVVYAVLVVVYRRWDASASGRQHGEEADRPV